MEDRTWKKATLCVQGGYQAHNGGPRVLPIYQSTTYRYDSSEELAKLFDLESDGHMYTRISNPTVAAVEDKIAKLEGALKQKEEEFSSSSLQLLEKQEDILKLTTALQSKEEEVTSLSKQLSFKRSSLDTLAKSEIQNLKRQLEEAESEVSSLSKQLDDKSQAVIQLQHEAEKLRERVKPESSSTVDVEEVGIVSPGSLLVASSGSDEAKRGVGIADRIAPAPARRSVRRDREANGREGRGDERFAVVSGRCLDSLDKRSRPSEAK